jgi:ribosomal protein S18 acetylase RimI-like enzyme
MSDYALAQLNVARMLAPMDSAQMADFKAGLQPLNTLADEAPGFVWRLQTDEGDATAVRPFEDDELIVNLSVWRDIDSLRAYAYRGPHADYLKRRREWFSRMAEAFAVLWWVPADHQPTPAEAADRLQHLRTHGPTAHAFTFARIFPSPVTTTSTPVIASLSPADRAAWEVLARGYKLFYNTPTSDDEYAAAWERLMADREVHALGAFLDGQLVGITHFLYHASTWHASVCYLQDLYTAPTYRGRGIARALIEAVAASAREHGAARCYWLTQHGNAAARALYDTVASYNGFIRYDYPMT